MALRPLFASVTSGDEYRFGRDAHGEHAAKMLSVDQIGTLLEDLTGYRFSHDAYDLLGSDTYGVRTLAGGVDGVYATKPANDPMATSVLVLTRVGQAAAWYVTEHDRAAPSEARLFTKIDFSESPSGDRERMAEQIQELHLRLFGAQITTDGPEVEANLALWEDLYVVDADKEAAWAGLLSVLFRDPAFLLY